MKYISVFITLCIILIILSCLAMGFIFYKENPNRYYHKGEASFYSGNYDQAIEAFNEYLSYDYQNAKSEKARYFLAAAIDNKRALVNDAGSRNAAGSRSGSAYDKLAKNRYLNVINNNTKGTYRVEAIIGYADIARRNREYDRFILNKLEGVLRTYPERNIDNKIYMLIGYQYLFCQEYEKAMNAFLHSASELSKLGQAEAHIKMGKFESAFKIYEDFLRYSPSSSHVSEITSDFKKYTIHYADLHRQNKKYLLAIPFYMKLIDYFPNSPSAETARFRIGECYFLMGNNFDKAREYFLKAFEDSAHTKDDVSLFYIGLCHYKMDHYAEAYKYFNLLVNQYPNSVYLNRAKQWVRQVNKDMEYFRK